MADDSSDLAIRRAVRVMGSQAALARALGVTQPTVCGWCAGREVSGKHVIKIEGLTGISRHDLNPGLYPKEASAPAASTMEPVR